jgi:hypothetical protein
MGIGIGAGPSGGGVYVAPGGNCRTVTVQYDDGSVRRESGVATNERHASAALIKRG